MTCPACGGRTVAFAVPPALRVHAPESASRAAVCTACLRTTDAGDRDPDDGDGFDALHPGFPTGEAGAALALALGLLDSLALRRDAVDACCGHAERAGGDVLLTLDRLSAAAEAGDLDPHVDLDRRRRQLADLLR